MEDIHAALFLSSQAQARFEVGLAPPAARMQAHAEVVQLTLRLQQMAATLDLRKQALSEAIKNEDLIQQLRRLELTTQRQQIEREIEMLRARLQEIRRLNEIGTSGELELKRAEIELLERQINLQRIIQEFQKVTAGRRWPVGVARCGSPSARRPAGPYGTIRWIVFRR